MVHNDNPKLLEMFNSLHWNMKLQVLQTIAGWTQTEAAEKYGTSQKQVWNWNQGKVKPRRNSRRAIADAHELDVTDIFPESMLKPGELQKGA